MITTKPVFYYNFSIDSESFYLNFDDGLGDIAATLIPGKYSAEDLADEIARALSDIGGQDYSCLFNRDTRKYTISADSNFSLLITSGANVGLSAFSSIGFNGSDLSGSNSYTSDSAVGSSYSPQFPLQSYVGPGDFKEYGETNINETASGKVEVYSIGLRSFIEFDIRYATNYPQGTGGLLENDPAGVENLRDFMQYCITKGDVEFMEDETDRSTYYTILLESTQESKNGTGYKLNELYSRNLPGYFETGKLKWRVKG